MPVSPRALVESLPVYKPGRNPDDLARELGLDSAIKLASNESGYGPLPSVVKAVADAAGLMNRYPDNGALALTEALAKKLGVTTAELAVGGGSVALLQQVIAAFAGPGDEVVYGWRSFEAYPIFPLQNGASSVQVPLVDETYSLPGLLAAITPATKVVIVCNPNNPTSTAVSEGLEDFIDSVPASVLVVLDEAYREFVGPTIPDGLALRRDNVLVLRTFSKAYGLAGLRVGYGVGDPAVISAVRALQLPFSISTVAQAAAVASLDAEEELLQRVEAVIVERDRVSSALAAAGFSVPESHANFVWLPLGDQATAFAQRCEGAGVIVRPFAGDGVRVTIGTPAENDRFLAIATGS